jgi:hypothetical protein
MKSSELQPLLAVSSREYYMNFSINNFDLFFKKFDKLGGLGLVFFIDFFNFSEL